jgi:polysaccharide pyruvyl transferase WcaK-like protein
MKKLGLIGYFGWGNFGDELFLEVHKQYLSKDYEIKVVNDLLQEPYFSRPIKELVNDYDAFLIGGGDLINPVRVSSLYWQMDFLNKPVFVYGIGVPNVKWSRKHVLEHYKKFFMHQNCKLVVARDVESYNWIKENFELEDKLKWFPDPVCSYNRPKVLIAKEKILGIVMRNHRSLEKDFRNIRKLINDAKKNDYKIKHIVLANKDLGKGDYEIAKEISEEGEEIFYSESLEEMCQEISKCSLLASIKFHGMVVASMYGIPTIAMSVTPKNRNFLKMLEREEMLVSYTDTNLFKRLSYYPANIHTIVRGNLFRRSKQGYLLLKEMLQEHV